jgi:hypothetical protein
MLLRSHVFMSGACLILIAPARSMAQGTPSAELLATDQATSAISRDSGIVAALAKSLSAEGVLLWPGAPVLFGIAEARRVLLPPQTRDTMRLFWQPLGVELAVDSTMGVSWGVAVVAPRLKAGLPQIGRYTAVWQRGTRGWTISALGFMSLKSIHPHLPADVPATRRAAQATGPAAPFVAADLAFAQLARDSGAAIAFRTWAAPNAFVIAGLLTRGPDDIARGVEGSASWRWHPVAAGSSRSGDLGWTVGEAVITPSTGEPNYSKYLTVWTRTPNNSIRFLTDAGNARPAVSDSP